MMTAVSRNRFKFTVDDHKVFFPDGLAMLTNTNNGGVAGMGKCNSRAEAGDGRRAAKFDAVLTLIWGNDNGIEVLPPE